MIGLTAGETQVFFVGMGSVAAAIQGKRLRALGAQVLDPMPMTVDEFAQRLRSDYDKYERLIQSTGARNG